MPKKKVSKPNSGEISKVSLKEVKTGIHKKYGFTEEKVDTDSPLEDERNIQKNWERVQKQKHENAVLLAQGNVRYKDED